MNPINRKLHESRIAIYYRDQMAPAEVAGFSKSPTKPRRFMEFLRGTPVWPFVDVVEEFPAATREDLILAHDPRYVDQFLDPNTQFPPGTGWSDGRFSFLHESSGITWSPEFRDSVLHTNGSLIAAIRAACARPEVVTMSPTSGFHHAQPHGGSGYCTFSGQVIAALRLWQERQLRGAWIDMDGHFGNSIEDSREFAPEIDQAIRRGCNLNPRGSHGDYLADLADLLVHLGELVVNGRVHYVCVAHGADSHEWDQLGGGLSTNEWIVASEMVYGAIRAWSRRLGRPVPVTLSLFGGYRDDHPESVLGLHATDTARCLALLGRESKLLNYSAEVRPPMRMVG